MIVLLPKMPADIVKHILFRAFPNYFGDGQLPACFHLQPGVATRIFQEFAYWYMQSTKPDTLGKFRVEF